MGRALLAGMDKRTVCLVVIAAALAGCSAERSFDPERLSLSPSDSTPGRTETVVLRGASGFTPGTSVTASFGPDTLASAVVETPDRIVATVTIGSAAALGSRAVLLVSESGQAIGMAGAFTVRPPFVVEGDGVRAGEWTEIHLRGLRTHWTSSSEVVAGPTVRVLATRVDAPDDLTAIVQIDLFAHPASVTLSVDGEQAPDALPLAAAQVVDLGDEADATGTLDGLVSEFRVWRGTLSAGEVAGFVARKAEGDVAASVEIYDPAGSGFEPVAILEPENGAVETSFGRSVWIVARSTLVVPTVVMPYDFSFRRVVASPLSATNSSSRWVSDAAQVDAWRIETVEPWSLLHVTVDATGWMVDFAPVVLTSRSNNWQIATRAGEPGGILDLPTLAPSSGETFSLLIRSGSSQAGGGYRVTTTSSPLPGMLFTREQIDGRFDATPLTDSVAVSGAPDATVVHVAIDIEHSMSGHLHATLTSPTGLSRELLVPSGDAGHPGLVTAFPDLAQPAEDLSELADSGSPNGTWTLTVSDPVSDTPGTLRGWAITFE